MEIEDEDDSLAPPHPGPLSHFVAEREKHAEPITAIEDGLCNRQAIEF